MLASAKTLVRILLACAIVSGLESLMLVLSVITSLNPHVCLGCFRCPCPRGGRRRLMLVSARILGGLEFGYDHDLMRHPGGFCF